MPTVTTTARTAATSTRKATCTGQGRLSNIIKTGGANVSPLEIEEALLSFPNMRIGIPFGAPHPSLGEVIVLCAVAMQGHALEEEDILAFLREKLAAYKLPRKILLFAESDLSFTGTPENTVRQVNRTGAGATAR